MVTDDGVRGAHAGDERGFEEVPATTGERLARLVGEGYQVVLDLREATSAVYTEARVVPLTKAERGALVQLFKAPRKEFRPTELISASYNSASRRFEMMRKKFGPLGAELLVTQGKGERGLDAKRYNFVPRPEVRLGVCGLASEHPPRLGADVPSTDAEAGGAGPLTEHDAVPDQEGPPRKEVQPADLPQRPRTPPTLEAKVLAHGPFRDNPTGWTCSFTTQVRGRCTCTSSGFATMQASMWQALADRKNGQVPETRKAKS